VADGKGLLYNLLLSLSTFIIPCGYESEIEVIHQAVELLTAGHTFLYYRPSVNSLADEEVKENKVLPRLRFILIREHQKRLRNRPARG